MGRLTAGGDTAIVMDTTLPADVHSLLRERIASYEQLHLLRLVFKDRRLWSVEQLAAESRLPAATVQSDLSALIAQQLVVSVPDVRCEAKYGYASGVHDATVQRLMQAYADQPISVMRSLAEQSIERIRADALRAFADAFLFRKGK